MTKKDKDTFKIIVDNKPQDWEEATITGAQLKALAGVDAATYDMWQEMQGPDDELIENDQVVNLTEKGTERFFSGKSTTREG